MIRNYCSLLFLFFYTLGFGQISFTTEINPGGKLRHIDAPLVLSNGNIFVSTRMDSFPEVDGPEFNTLFLFDECGNHLAKTRLIEEDVDLMITNSIEVSDGNIFCSAYYLTDAYYKIYLVLDRNDLTIKRKRKFITTNYISEYLTLLNGEIFEFGSNGILGFSQIKEASLSRKFNLYRLEYDDNTRFKTFAFANTDRICFENKFYNIGTTPTSSFKCVDKYLDELYSINLTNDSIVFKISGQPIDLQNEIVLLPTAQKNLNSNEWTSFVNQYKRDSLIFSREAEYDEFFVGSYNNCIRNGKSIYCKGLNLTIQEFNLKGDWMGENSNLADTLSGNDLNKFIINENVIIGAADNWVFDEQQQKWTSFLKLFKTNEDFDIPKNSEESCIDAISSEAIISYCDLFPNPSSNGFIVETSAPLKSYTITNQAGQVVLSEQNLPSLNSISFNKLEPGFYVLHLLTNNNISIQKKVIAIDE